VNVFGLARLVQLLLPLMRQQQSGRVVNISSIGGKIWEPLGAWYHATKFAVEGFSDCLRMELKPFGIDVIVIEPGAIRTEWGQIALDAAEKTSGHTVYAPQFAEKRALFGAADGGSGSDPDVVAREILKAVQARRPKTRYAVGAGATPAILMAKLLPDRTFDSVVAAIHRAMLKRSLKAAPQGTDAPSLPARTKA
jgi:NAD(P)-dependent dehydrogenase (short-subunit alcohol dehydrogenase family)